MEGSAYVYNVQKQEVRVIDKNEMVTLIQQSYANNVLKGVAPSWYFNLQNNCSYKDIIQNDKLKYLFASTTLKNVYHCPLITKETLIVAFDKTLADIQKMVGIDSMTSVSFDKKYVSGGAYRDRSIKETLNKDMDKMTLKLPVTLELEYIIRGGKESQNKDDKWMDALLEIRASKVNWDDIKEQVKQAIFNEVQRNAKVKLKDMQIGGNNLVEIPSEIHIR